MFGNVVMKRRRRRRRKRSRNIKEGIQRRKWRCSFGRKGGLADGKVVSRQRRIGNRNNESGIRREDIDETIQMVDETTLFADEVVLCNGHGRSDLTFAGEERMLGEIVVESFREALTGRTILSTGQMKRFVFFMESNVPLVFSSHLAACVLAFKGP